MKYKSPYLNLIAEYMVLHQYSLRSIETYLKWISGYIHFHQMRHPASMGNTEVEQYLEYLSLKANVAPRTQATALNSLSFLYKNIVKQELSSNLNFAMSKRQSKLPIVMTQDEVKLLLSKMTKRYYLIATASIWTSPATLNCIDVRTAIPSPIYLA